MVFLKIQTKILIILMFFSLFSKISVEMVETTAYGSNDVDFEFYYDNDLVFFYGPGLGENFTVSLEALRNGTYDRVENINFTRVNKMNNTYTYDLSASLLWDLLHSSNKLL